MPAATAADSEDFTALLARPGLKIERIVSRGQASPPGFWYDQPRNEWVIVLKGGAGLRFEDEPSERVLGAGDYVFIPARKRHRVEWTAPLEATVWLAVHFE
jgi:cupin 2 domain-containing protein